MGGTYGGVCIGSQADKDDPDPSHADYALSVRDWVGRRGLKSSRKTEASPISDMFVFRSLTAGLKRCP